MEERTYSCQACGMTIRLSAMDLEDGLAECPWCGEPLEAEAGGGPARPDDKPSDEPSPKG